VPSAPEVIRKDEPVIERLQGLPPGIDGIRPVGTLTPEDYQTVVAPLLDAGLREGRPLRCLVEIGPEFTGLTPAAAWEDVKLGLRALHAFAGCAVVTDTAWIAGLTRFASFLMPYPVRTFAVHERDAAVDWLVSLPEGPGISHRLIEDKGIVVVEVDEPLRAADFEALARTIDPWIEANGELRGIVLHAKKVPGWENIGALMRHLRFVHDHHKRIRRAAAAVDGALAELAPAIARHFVHAEVRRFDYDQLEEAVTWAAASS
jgi:hypothetical protein